jgi:hypothetical protein
MAITLCLLPCDDEISEKVGMWFDEFAFRDLVADVTNRKVEILRGHEVQRRAVHDRLAKGDVDLVAFFGHGMPCYLSSQNARPLANQSIQPCELCGSDTLCPGSPCEGRPLLDEGQMPLCASSAHLLNGRLLFMVACHAGKVLGKTVADLPAAGSGFFGFDGELMVPTQEHDVRLAEIGRVMVTALSELHRGLSQGTDRKILCKRVNSWIYNGLLRIKSGLRFAFDKTAIETWLHSFCYAFQWD